MMRCLLILFLIIPLASFSQETISFNQQTVGFACGPLPTATKVVKEIELLIKNKHYTDLAKLLDSNEPSKKFLAAFCIDKLFQNKKIFINEPVVKKIERIKQSEDLVSVCSGCTYQKKLSIKELMNKKHFIYHSANYWFKELYKHYY